MRRDWTLMKDNPKRDLILQAGSECFARFGYDKTTLDDIGKRAGLNKASLYYYFKNKEEIFIAVVLSETEAFIADLRKKALSYPAPAEQVRFFLTERIRRYSEVIHLTRLSVEHLQKLEPLFDEVYQETKASEVSFLTELLAAGRDSGAFHLPDQPEMVAERLFELSDALKHDCVRAAGRFPGAEMDFSSAIAGMDFWVNLILLPASAKG